MITYNINDWSQFGEEVAFDVTAKAPTGEHIRATVTLAIGDESLVPTFKDVERWVPAELLIFFTAHSEDPACEVEDGLLDALRAVVSLDASTLTGCAVTAQAAARGCTTDHTAGRAVGAGQQSEGAAMTTNKVWVISGESGEYSDTTWWVVSVVKTKDDGEAIIKDLEAEVTRIASMRPVPYYENGVEDAIKAGCMIVTDTDDYDAPKRREPTLLARVDPWGAGRWPSYYYDTKPVRYSLTEVDVVTLAKLRGQP